MHEYFKNKIICFNIWVSIYIIMLLYKSNNNNIMYEIVSECLNCVI